MTASTSSQKLFNATTNGTLTLSTGTYFFELHIIIYNVTTNFTGHTLSIKGAGTATIATVGMSNADGYKVAVADSSPMIEDNNLNSGQLIVGSFRVTSSGTIIPSISLTAARASVVKAGSFFRCERLGAESVDASSGWS